MQVERCGSVGEFLAATLEYRSSEPLRTNVIGSVATLIAAGTTRWRECYWWIVRDEVGEVVGVGMRTVPFVLSLGPMTAEAARALAVEVDAVDVGIPGVAGFLEPVTAFLDELGPPRDVLTSQHQLLYAIEHVVLPDVDGELVAATPAEFDLVEAWYEAFSVEVDGIRPRARSEGDRAALHETVVAGRVRWWRVDGATVSMAAHSVPVETPAGIVTRVGPVYTPPELRRRGYAAAVTATVSKLLLDGGSEVMLYADAANPTSNHVYRSLGYELVDEFVRHDFRAPA